MDKVKLFPIIGVGAYGCLVGKSASEFIDGIGDRRCDDDELNGGGNVATLEPDTFLTLVGGGY
eukprot:7525318-Ditylum_brightwellii.AAC.1